MLLKKKDNVVNKNIRILTKEVLSPSLEDYLKTIYLLSQHNNVVREKDIVTALSVSRPSVTRAVRLLTDKKLVAHELYGHLTLTAYGLSKAIKIMERYQRIKIYLIYILGVAENQAEHDACLLEHVLSPATIEKISAFVTKVS
jgi:DtxR family Mn-dependent transcriptional regulator